MGKFIGVGNDRLEFVHDVMSASVCSEERTTLDSSSGMQQSNLLLSQFGSGSTYE
jgi:hypothetical protein